MKDLKHLIFFENLLQDAQNELVTQAVNDGKIALGYNCYYIPASRAACARRAASLPTLRPTT